ncbi:MAG: radical SAM protein [Desulfobacteraceae bacterium]|nr:radical SAM protein [Desulfobacteraceae bacterium]
MFEQGVIRPPGEAYSLLVRATRNCPWNRCHICPAFKGKKFSKRSVAEVRQDIDEMADTYGPGKNNFDNAFLQDADSLILPTDQLVEIITYIKHRFPAINRVTTYARAKSMKKKGPEQYKRLKGAGLTRIHTGMESGSENVLKIIQKGNTPKDILEGGMRVRESGISLCEYIMPGVGGRTYSREHALKTAEILNQIRPDFIRVRSFALHPMSPLQRVVDEGGFELMTDEEVVEEIRMLLVNLDEMPSYFRCADFSLNLLMQIDGRLDKDKDAMIREIDRFLSLGKDKQRAYVLLQRSYPGMKPLDMLEDEQLLEKLYRKIQELEDQEEGGFEKYIRLLKSYQLPQPQTKNWGENKSARSDKS